MHVNSDKQAGEACKGPFESIHLQERSADLDSKQSNKEFRLLSKTPLKVSEVKQAGMWFSTDFYWSIPLEIKL